LLGDRWIAFSEGDGKTIAEAANIQAARPQSLYQRVEDNVFRRLQ
jgi:hypothetical protein